MAVPRNRRSSSKQGKVRSHHARKPKNLCACSNCKTLGLSHHMCPSCGFYKGKAVIQINATA